jgi:hypothetical protein
VRPGCAFFHGQSVQESEQRKVTTPHDALHIVFTPLPGEEVGHQHRFHRGSTLRHAFNYASSPTKANYGKHRPPQQYQLIFSFFFQTSFPFLHTVHHSLTVYLFLFLSDLKKSRKSLSCLLSSAFSSGTGYFY